MLGDARDYFEDNSSFDEEYPCALFDDVPAFTSKRKRINETENLEETHAKRQKFEAEKSFHTPDLTLFHNKINTALIYTKYTVALGADNKISDYKKTNGWSDQVLSTLPYVKQTNGKWILAENPKKRFTTHYPITAYDPLMTEPVFTQNWNLKSLVESSIKAARQGAGNCGRQSDVLAAYLWRKPHQAIHRIELISTTEFDHAWVIINRQKESKLSKPDEWGNAWIIDPWWQTDNNPNGKYYPANQFQDRYKEIFSFYTIQKEWLEKHHLNTFNDSSSNDSLEEPYDALESICDIDVATMPYPQVENDIPIESYYDYSPHVFYSRKGVEAAYAIHKNQFTPCLKQIEEPKQYLRKGSLLKH